MEEYKSKDIYSLQDLHKAFDMGLETAVFVLEKMIGLTPEGQQTMLDALKEKIQKEKCKVLQMFWKWMNKKEYICSPKSYFQTTFMKTASIGGHGFSPEQEE